MIERAEQMLPQDSYFVGGHPMAGLEVTGVTGAREDLFDGATYVFTPTANTEISAINSLKDFAHALGSKVLELEPAEHDRAVALISHLPHLLAATLVNTVAADDDCGGLLKLAGGGFRDATRIAASNSNMWRDILLTNREMVLQSVREFRFQLEEMEQAIINFNREDLVSGLIRAKEVRESLPENRKYVSRIK
ncbi:hypothetical protein N752_22340 [Desulforamulus aquiferis]|nr:hypothetical protein N752_22340 [Desulforamulus aquiferis]